jgi:hypothetical protein
MESSQMIKAIASQSESFCYTYVGELKMAAPSEEQLICDKFNLEALTVNQVKSFKALTDGKDVFIETSDVFAKNV